MKLLNINLKFIKKIFLFFTLSFLFNHSVLPTEISHSKSIPQKLTSVREEFEDLYYKLVKEKYFDINYSNNLILNIKTVNYSLQTALELLKLIQWLSHKNDLNSRYLLKKLNKYLFLHVNHLLQKLDNQKTQSGMHIGTLHDLYYFTSQAPDGLKVHPFRTSIAIAILVIFINNLEDKYYEEKKETCSLELALVKKELLKIRAQYSECTIPEKDIKKFFIFLNTYTIKEPIVQTSHIKKYIIYTLITASIVIIVIIIWKFIYEEQWHQWLISKWEGFKAGTQEWIHGVWVQQAEATADVLQARAPNIITNAVHALDQSAPEAIAHAVDPIKRAAQETINTALENAKHTIQDTLDHAREGLRGDLQATITTALENAQRTAQETLAHAREGLKVDLQATITTALADAKRAAQETLDHAQHNLQTTLQTGIEHAHEHITEIFNEQIPRLKESLEKGIKKGYTGIPGEAAERVGSATVSGVRRLWNATGGRLFGHDDAQPLAQPAPHDNPPA